MSDLHNKKCIPCEGGIPGFNITEIHKYLKMVNGWEVKEDENKRSDNNVLLLSKFLDNFTGSVHIV